MLYPVYEQREDGIDVYAGMQLKFPGTRQRMLLPHLPEDTKLKEVKVRPYYGKYLLILVLEAEEPPVGEAGPNIAGIGIIPDIEPLTGSGIKTRQGIPEADRQRIEGLWTARVCTAGRLVRRFERRKRYGSQRYHLHRIRRSRQRSGPHGDGGSCC